MGKNKKSSKKSSRVPHGEDILSPQILNQITEEADKTRKSKNKSSEAKSICKTDHIV